MIKINISVGSPGWKKKIKNIENYFKIKQRRLNNYLNSSKKHTRIYSFINQQFQDEKFKQRI